MDRMFLCGATQLNVQSTNFALHAFRYRDRPPAQWGAFMAKYCNKYQAKVTIEMDRKRPCLRRYSFNEREDNIVLRMKSSEQKISVF